MALMVSSRASDVWLTVVGAVGAGGFVTPCVPVAMTPAGNEEDAAETDWTEAAKIRAAVEAKASMMKGEKLGYSVEFLDVRGSKIGQARGGRGGGDGGRRKRGMMEKLCHAVTLCCRVLFLPTLPLVVSRVDAELRSVCCYSYPQYSPFRMHSGAYTHQCYTNPRNAYSITTFARRSSIV